VEASQCPLWVISGHFAMRKPCPLYPRKRTCSARYSSMRSINVGSSPAAFELFTLRDTEYICSDL
jgi:hypothetical protein